jgi:hypothetical protein
MIWRCDQRMLFPFFSASTVTQTVEQLRGMKLENSAGFVSWTDSFEGSHQESSGIVTHTYHRN